MNQQFSTGHILKADPNSGVPCWTVAKIFKKRGKPGETYLDDYHYYVNLQSALYYLLDLRLKRAESVESKLVIREIEAFRRETSDWAKNINLEGVACKSGRVVDLV